MKIKIYKSDNTTDIPIPYILGGVQAGFPSPAEDYMEGVIDLNRELIKNPSTTFFARVVGKSMIGDGIDENDILVVDKSLDLSDNDLAVCFLDGEFTLKRVRIESEAIYLVPSNPDFKEIKVTADNDFMVWGIVTYTIKSMRRTRAF